MARDIAFSPTVEKRSDVLLPGQYTPWHCKPYVATVVMVITARLVRGTIWDWSYHAETANELSRRMLNRHNCPVFPNFTIRRKLQKGD